MKNGNLTKVVNSINNKKDFIKFIKLLEEDFKNNGDNWENVTINDFLESLGAYCNDSEKYDNSDINWNLIAYLLLGGRNYE